jgi:ABC-type lipoprotein export system ATPase subunit/GNAT superfamily N-acetyltransferase
MEDNRPRWSMRVNAQITRRVDGDGDAVRVASMFGLAGENVETLYDDLALEIEPGQIVGVTGPSGAGKSVLLQEIARQVPDARFLAAGGGLRSRRPAVATLRGGSLSKRLAVLSRCGLAEATALVTPARHLSGGQQYRLALARELHAAERTGRPALLLADEFAAPLDDETAHVLCRQLRRRVRESRLAVVVATGRQSLLGSLRPDITIHKPMGLAVAQVDAPGPRPTGGPRVDRWPVEAGRLGDYHRLGRFHYLAGPPALHKRVYVVRPPRVRRRHGAPDPAAVLVISPPLLNVRGRNLATAGRYLPANRSAGTALLNAEIECISRVVVHPIYRGCGLAVRLIRHALADARTPLTEALAAMGTIHPLFERAGMRAWHLGPDEHQARLLGEARTAGLDQRDLWAVEPVRRLLKRRTRRARRFGREFNRYLKRAICSQRRARLADPVAELCRTLHRRYVYYLSHPAWPLDDPPGPLADASARP